MSLRWDVWVLSLESGGLLNSSHLLHWFVLHYIPEAVNEFPSFSTSMLCFTMVGLWVYKLPFWKDKLAPSFLFPVLVIVTPSMLLHPWGSSCFHRSSWIWFSVFPTFTEITSSSTVKDIDSSYLVFHPQRSGSQPHRTPELPAHARL